LLFGAAVAACFAAGNTHAAAAQPIDPGWQDAQPQPEQGGPGWTRNANAGGAVEQAYTAFPAVDQGGPGRHPNTAAPARQRGPGWNAPDARVDDSTHVQPSSTAAGETGGTITPPDQAAVAAYILFPPYSAELSGDATAALSNVAEGVGELPGTVVVTARVDPMEQGDAAGLSLARAQGVADYLAEVGVDPQRIVLQAVGDTQPLIDPRICQSATGPDRVACLAPDRSVTVQVGRFDVGMIDVD
jgi:outer membrane protein OmpA-like peptidoglycan-associated protein